MEMLYIYHIIDKDHILCKRERKAFLQIFVLIEKHALLRKIKSIHDVVVSVDPSSANHYKNCFCRLSQSRSDFIKNAV